MKTKLEALSKAMEIKYRDEEKKDETAFYCISDNCDSDLKKVLMTLVYDDNIGGASDMSYELCYEAVNFLADLTEEDYKNDDMQSVYDDYEPASIYTAERLQYLNNNNQQEISDIMKEYSTEDIATACAIWYDNMVKQAIEKIISEYLMK